MEDLAARPPEPGGTAYSLFIAVHEDAARNRRSD